MWSMPLPRVKKRSKRPVMSFSICSGGMPEKKVATTTTGMRTAGKRSTGMRTRLVTPITQIIKHMTMMRYGYRMEKRDMEKKGELAFGGGPRLIANRTRVAAGDLPKA